MTGLLDRFEHTDGLPFPDDEYEARLAKVRATMTQRGIDVLYVTHPSNLYYLTGFASIWYSGRSPLGAAVAREGGEVVFYDYSRHRTLVEKVARATDYVIYDYETVYQTIANDFRARGWHDGVVALEDWSWSPAGPTKEALRAALTGVGARTADGSWIVDNARLIKSPREIECVRTAADIVNGAMAEMADHIRPGMTGVELTAHLNLLMAQRGGEYSGIPTGVETDSSGLAHFPASRKRVAHGNVIELDACGVFNKYHVNCLRTFAVGPNERAQSVLEVTSGSIEKICREVKVGTPLTEAQRIGDEYVADAGLSKYVWWVGGYSLGVSFPPDWTGHVYLDGGAFETPTFQPGFVTNYENVLVSPEEKWTAAYIDTLLMTEDGLEILTTVPRSLTVVQ